MRESLCEKERERLLGKNECVICRDTPSATATVVGVGALQFTVLNFTQPEPRRVVVRWRMEWPTSKAAEEWRQMARRLQVRGQYRNAHCTS